MQSVGIHSPAPFLFLELLHAGPTSARTRHIPLSRPAAAATVRRPQRLAILDNDHRFITGVTRREFLTRKVGSQNFRGAGPPLLDAGILEYPSHEPSGLGEV